MKYSEKVIEKFLSKVDKERSTVFYNGTRCWEWVAGCTSLGYGALSFEGKTIGVHRVSYELSFGEIKNNLHVLHHCDNRCCVNPNHLFLGTEKDNKDDMVKKGRQARGESHGMAKLTDEQVAEIRRRYGRNGKGGETLVALAKKFGVHSSVVSDYVNYRIRK